MTPIDYFGLMVMLLIATDFCEKLLDEWWIKTIGKTRAKLDVDEEVKVDFPKTHVPPD